MSLLPFYKENTIEAGCDEAGRGCLAGPVYAAAVVLPPDFKNPDVKDSKKIPEKKRYLLREIIEKEAVSWAVAQLDNLEIEKMNIFKAAMRSMHMAVEGLKVIPELLLIDGHLFINYPKIPHVCVVKGDDKYYSIAAASILAKTYRDDFMKKAHDEFPQYDWLNNKGYGTKKHCAAIDKYGITPYHRKTFRMGGKQLKLDFKI